MPPIDEDILVESAEADEVAALQKLASNCGNLEVAVASCSLLLAAGDATASLHAGGIETVFQSMQANPASIDLQRTGMAVIARMCAGAVQARTMTSMPDIVTLALTSLQTNDIGVRKAGCDAIAELAVSPENKNALGAKGCDL
eukprot:COSAG01_NODE_33200_length_568_cov_1.002132_1_plen_142_part_01